MNTNQLFGVIAISLGLLNLIIHLLSYFGIQVPFLKFWKLEPMKKFWGNKLGMVIHFITYAILPIIFGLYLLSI
jgi:hypothetical protein